MVCSLRDQVLLRTDKATGETRKIRVKFWNDTVANLTLMALGSSAPEILLSVTEVDIVKVKSILALRVVLVCTCSACTM